MSPLGLPLVSHESALIVARIEADFRLSKDNGSWRVTGVRTGSRNWADPEAIQNEVTREKAARAQAELQTIAKALEDFRRQRGYYVDSQSEVVLIDFLSPLYLSRLIRLDPRQARRALASGALLIDTRPEFQRRADGEVPGAIVIERNHLEWRLHPDSSGRIPEAVDTSIQWIVMCDEGYASSLAAATLQQMGLRNATDVIGGFRAWRAARLPVKKPSRVTPPRLAPRRGGRR
jgi:rhodanese-related sulfurtransferase